ncbi:hypothetical protein INT47_003803 [Mucor saturninus]|uniref:Zf-UBP-domain-containing protein n=1 Tax=Mucor saturninus TaxID=64648 RepID=A0A8H7V9H3_9FUNG|nr:hypothetical protein INT47_003803 [Mucor saturninus]
MYYYKLKCVLYTPESVSMPNDFFGDFPTLNMERVKYLENYKHANNKSRTLRRRSSQPAKSTTVENIPPTPIDTMKPHLNHSLEGQVDFRFGPIELHALDTSLSANKKKKRMEEKTTQLGYGVLHLYRDVETVSEQDLPDTKIAKDESLNIVSDQDTVLCILAVPSYMSYKDLLDFLGSTNSSITHYRFIRDYSPNKYTVLLKFKNRQSAFACYQKFNGRRFNMTEPEISHVVYIQSNTVESILIPPQMYPSLNETLAQDVSHKNTMAELPTCPVCLERMDESVTGLLGIQCHHTSQCYCLEKWGENRCPICQYSHKPVLTMSHSKKRTVLPIEEEEVVYQCCECVSTESLWICMICGHVGCGRYQDAHAYDHYMDTNHLYALEIETQRVWDYVGDGYVHKLIQNTIDGAIVELPPNSTGNSLHTERDAVSKRNSNHGMNQHPDGSGGSSIRDSTAHQTGQQGKLDSISVDYSYMLSSQLDSQRMYYEDQLDGLTRQLSDLTNQIKMASNEINEATREGSLLLEKGQLLDASINDIKKEKEKADKRASTYKDKYEAMQKNLNEEKLLTKSLIRNNGLLKKDAEGKDATLKVLGDQVKDLMFFLEAREKVKEGDSSK